MTTVLTHKRVRRPKNLQSLGRFPSGGHPGLVPNPRFARRDPAGRVPFPRQCASINLAGVGGLRPDAVVKPKIADAADEAAHQKSPARGRGLNVF
jgi:hypothetical protein